MKYKIKDQPVSLNFESLQNNILDALKNSDKEFSIAVYDENDIKIATAVIDVSRSTLELDRIELTEQFKENNKSNPQVIVTQKNQILEQFTRSLKVINEEIKERSTSVVELLTEYRELFIQYPKPQSELRRFIDGHENSEYKDVFARFIPEFSRLSTPSFQEKLNDLYQEFISLVKKLNDPELNEKQRNDVIENNKKDIAAQQQALVRFFSQTQNLAMLSFLERELPKFEPAAKAWNQYAKQIEEENAESLAKFKEEVNKKHQKEIDDLYNNDENLQKYAQKILKAYIARFPEKYDENTKTEIPITFLKHPEMRQSVVELLRTEDKIDPEEISKLPSLEKLISLGRVLN